VAVDVRCTAAIKIMDLLFCIKRNAFNFGINWKSNLMLFKHMIHILQDGGLGLVIENMRGGNMHIGKLNLGKILEDL
jgi:hypothetical protein